MAIRKAEMSAEEHERARSGAETLMRFLDKQPEDSVTADDVAGGRGADPSSDAESPEPTTEGA